MTRLPPLLRPSTSHQQHQHSKLRQQQQQPYFHQHHSKRTIFLPRFIFLIVFGLILFALYSGTFTNNNYGTTSNNISRSKKSDLSLLNINTKAIQNTRRKQQQQEQQVIHNNNNNYNQDHQIINSDNQYYDKTRIDEEKEKLTNYIANTLLSNNNNNNNNEEEDYNSPDNDNNNEEEEGEEEGEDDNKEEEEGYGEYHTTNQNSADEQNEFDNNNNNEEEEGGGRYNNNEVEGNKDVEKEEENDGEEEGNDEGEEGNKGEEEEGEGEGVMEKDDEATVPDAETNNDIATGTSASTSTRVEIEDFNGQGPQQQQHEDEEETDNNDIENTINNDTNNVENDDVDKPSKAKEKEKGGGDGGGVDVEKEDTDEVKDDGDEMETIIGKGGDNNNHSNNNSEKEDPENAKLIIDDDSNNSNNNGNLHTADKVITALMPSFLNEKISVITDDSDKNTNIIANSTGGSDGLTSKSIPDNNNNNNYDDDKDKDKDCPFRDSPIYRKVYVYPTPEDGSEIYTGDILSEYGRNNINLSSWDPYPWIKYDRNARNLSQGHYNIYGQNVQYTTELLVRELMINPKSCLRTYDPEDADLFYVPYLPSMEHHMGEDRKLNFTTSEYGQAIMNIIDKQDYAEWEILFGLTSKYWQKRNGSDHILVFSEPMHGLYHPRSKRGNFHYIHTQKQLASPIIISIELSTSFVQMYPNCAAKNILVPYPNTAGSWVNGQESKKAIQVLVRDTYNITASNSIASIPAERDLANQTQQSTSSSSSLMSLGNIPRPVGQYYAAGAHGTCERLRKSMRQDYSKCSKSSDMLFSKLGGDAKNFGVGMRLSTFCPCPGGDSPGAKRMFDAILAGCIPVILSYDFVWPLSTEFDIRQENTSDQRLVPLLNPNDFSIRLNAGDYEDPKLNATTCQPLDANKPGLEAYLGSVSSEEIIRLRTNGEQVALTHYSWYKPRSDLPENPLREGILPDGGLAHMVVNSLAERAQGRRWPACEEELKNLKPYREPDPKKFKC